MKEWWTTKAWPWLRANWQWVLFPIGILLFVLRFIPRGVVTIDPTAKADQRAREEKARRDADAAAEKARRDTALAEEQARLASRLAEVRQANQGKLQKLTEDQMAHAAQLEEDPDALNDWLRTL